MKTAIMFVVFAPVFQSQNDKKIKITVPLQNCAKRTF